jgi:hypothetical protein
MLLDKFKHSKLEQYSFRWFNNRSILELGEGIQNLVSIKLSPEPSDATVRVQLIIQFYREEYHHQDLQSIQQAKEENKMTPEEL